MKIALGLLMMIIVTGCEPPFGKVTPYNHEIAMSLAESANGEIVFAGLSIHQATPTRGNPLDTSPVIPSQELFYSKVTANGEWLWEKFVDLNSVEADRLDGAVGIRIRDGGGFEIAGARSEYIDGFLKDFLYLLRAAPDGSVESHMDSEVDSSRMFSLSHVMPRASGGFACIGNAGYYGWDESFLLVTNADDSLILNQPIEIECYIDAIAETGNGEIAIIGMYYDNMENTRLVAIADDGTETLDVTWAPTNFAAKALTATDNGYAVAGVVTTDICLAFVSATGSIEQVFTYPMERAQTASRVIRALNGDFVIAGVSRDNTQSSRGPADAIFLRISPSGELIWTVTNGNPEDENIRDLICTQDGGFVAGGSVDYQYGGDAYLLKVSGDGAIEWERVIGI